MTEVIKETITTQGSTNTVSAAVQSATSSQTVGYLIYFLFGILEMLLIARLILKLMGAGATGAFVDTIYGITGVFILPFEGIFRRGFTEGIETTSVLEPSTIVAIIVYAVVAWGIVKLVQIFSGERQTS